MPRPWGSGATRHCLGDVQSAVACIILTVTGNYAPSTTNFLPDYVRTDSVEALADRWIRRVARRHRRHGRAAGFIKLGSMAALERRRTEADALRAASRIAATGLTIGAHTGPASGGV
jgi:phosphotriesterase-related protein